jgi:hypothetical protein
VIWIHHQHIVNTISLKSILEGESNVDKFTFKQRDAGGVAPQNLYLIKETNI